MSGRSDVVAMCWGNLSCFPRSTCNCQSGAVWRSPVVICARARGLSSFDEGDGLLWSMMVFARADGGGYALGNCFEYLVVAPAVATISQGLWAAAEEMFQGASSGAQGAGRCLALPPYMEVRWAREGVVDCLHKEPDAVEVCLHDV